jgi:hypothetical protein
MQLLKTFLASPLFLCAIFVLLTGCASGSQMESEHENVAANKSESDETSIASADGVGLYDCENNDKTGFRVCFTAIDSILDCLMTADQALYRKCDIKVNYSVQTDFQRYSSFKVECQVEVEYMSRFGWVKVVQADEFKHALNPEGSESGSFDFLFKFNRHRKVTDVKDSVACVIADTFEY